MTTRLRHLVLLLAVTATLPIANPLLAAEAELTISDYYVRMVPPGTPTSGAFMTIKNGGSSDRTLVKADSPAAKSVELHTHINDQGMMKMRPVKAIDIKAHGQAELKPGSYHIMLIDLKQTLKEGETVPLTLTFDDGSTRKIDAPIKRPQAMLMEMNKGAEHGKMQH